MGDYRAESAGPRLNCPTAEPKSTQVSTVPKRHSSDPGGGHTQHGYNRTLRGGHTQHGYNRTLRGWSASTTPVDRGIN